MIRTDIIIKYIAFGAVFFFILKALFDYTHLKISNWYLIITILIIIVFSLILSNDDLKCVKYENFNNIQNQNIINQIHVKSQTKKI